jgi:hypothetical protein
MPDRRQFLTFAGTAGLAVALAGCGIPDHPVSATGAAALTAGSVTNPTGSVGGNNLSTLVDAYTGNFGGITEPLGTTQAQWNYLSLLSATPDPCARKGAGGLYAPNELLLLFVLVGYADLPNPAPWQPPAEALPLTFTGAAWLETSDQVYRQCLPQVMRATKGGKPGNAVVATGGTVTFTRYDATSQDGTYDLSFPDGGTAAGSFTAPWCGPPPG